MTSVAPSSKKEVALKEKVRVLARIRPQTKKEISIGGVQCVKYNDNAIEVTTEDGPYTFTFDRVFGPESTQAEIYEYSCLTLIGDVLSGYNATVFAYGQTASGKTFTMEGPDIRDETYKGIIPRTVEGLFEGVSQADETLEFTFKVSYIEIYTEKVRDLLDTHRVKTNLMIREDKIKGVYIAGVTEEYVTSQEELLSIMNAGTINRAVAATGMNEGSSRSHSVFTITITQRDVTTATSKSGKLVLVDLAGSEMVRKTNASGQQLEEAKTINKSLSALGQVIMALTDDKTSHIPYRDSKLTRILQDSLGGNSRTCLIVACSPSSYNAIETVSSLRFGMRAKSIENKVRINQTRSVEELEDLLARAERAIDAQQAHIMTLAVQLQQAASGGATSGDTSGSAQTEAILIVQLQATITRLQQELDEEREESIRQGSEAEKLSTMLNDKDRLLMEAGELMQEAQRHYEAQRDRADQLVRESAQASSEIELLRAQLLDESGKFHFEIEEIDATLEKFKKENEKLRAEISEMSGDRMSIGDGLGDVTPTSSNRRSRISTDGAISETTPAIRQRTASVTGEQLLTSGEFAQISLEGRHESKLQAQRELAELLRSIGATPQVGVAIATWADSYSSENDYWFNVAEEKIMLSENRTKEAQKRIQELKMQRHRLEDDLSTQIKKTQEHVREIEVLRLQDTDSENIEFVNAKERLQTRCLQQRLEQLVTVHRQLLRKFTSLELENGELKKKISLRNERIKQLEVNVRKMTGKLRIQIERHVSELTNLSENVQSMKLEQQQRMDAVTSQGQERSKFSGPRVVRGGQHGSITATPNSPPSPSSAVLRGGGGGSMSGGVATAQVVSVPESLTGSSMSKTTKQDSVSSAVSSSSSGLLSFFKGQSTKNL